MEMDTAGLQSRIGSRRTEGIKQERNTMVSADSGLSKWALGTTSCIYLVQTILLSVLLSLGAQWEACNWECSRPCSLEL